MSHGRSESQISPFSEKGLSLSNFGVFGFNTANDGAVGPRSQNHSTGAGPRCAVTDAFGL